MLLTVIITVTIFATNAVALSYEDNNEYIDTVLTGKFDEEIEYSRLDPYKFPDIHVDLISRRLTDNEAYLSKGKLHHLSKVQRSGSCSLPLWTFANVSFTCNLRFDELIVNYTANVTFDNMKLVFYPTTSITNTTVTIQITSNPHENVPSLKLFRVNTFGKIKVTSKMISVGDVSKDIVPPIVDSITSNSQINLHRVLMGRFKDVLGYSIYKSPLKFDG